MEKFIAFPDAENRNALPPIDHINEVEFSLNHQDYPDMVFPVDAANW